MFSQLESIFKNNFLPLRESDAHRDMGERNRARKKQNKKAEDQESESVIFGDDIMVVSIQTIKNFLDELLSAPNIMGDFKSSEEPPEKKAESGSDKPQADIKTAKAVAAYRKMAAESQEPPPREIITGHIDRQLYNLNQHEKDVLKALVTEIEILQKQKVRELHIPPNKTFLAGLLEAVEITKAGQED